MFEIPSIDKYKFHFSKDGRKVIAVSSYAGRPVRGIAKCSPEDENDIEKGKALAAARCNLKIARKRFARAAKKVDEASDEYNHIVNHVRAMQSYMSDSFHNVQLAEEQLNQILNNM